MVIIAHSNVIVVGMICGLAWAKHGPFGLQCGVALDRRGFPNIGPVLFVSPPGARSSHFDLPTHRFIVVCVVKNGLRIFGRQWGATFPMDFTIKGMGCCRRW